jgi:hypothetical protein
MVEKIMIIIVLNLIVYFRGIYNGWIVDDQLVPQSKGKNFIHTFFLQLHALAYSNSQFEHLQRIVIHAAVATLIFIAFGCSHVSFVAALLYSVNPSNNQGILWLNGVGYSMSTLCVLLMVAAPIFAFIPYMYTMAWHLTAFAAPLLFIFLPYKFTIAYIFIYILFAWMLDWEIPLFKAQKNATLRHRWNIPIEKMKKLYIQKIPFIMKCYTYYFFCGLIPYRLGLYHTFGYSFGLSEKDTNKWQSLSPLFWFSIIHITSVIFIIVLFWGTSLSLGLFWFSLFIAQWCNVVMMQQPIAERYLYLPNVGLMLSLSWVLFLTPYPYEIASFIIGAYLVKLLQIIPSYKTQKDYVEYSIINFPDQHALYNWRGLIARTKGHVFSALSAWTMGLRFRDDDYKLNFNVANILMGLGFLKEADKYLLKAGECIKNEGGNKEMQDALEQTQELLRNRIAGKKIILPHGVSPKAYDPKMVNPKRDMFDNDKST